MNKFELFSEKCRFDYFKKSDYEYNEELFHTELKTLCGIPSSKEEEKMFKFFFWGKGDGVHLRYVAGLYCEFFGIDTMGIKF